MQAVAEAAAKSAPATDGESDGEAESENAKVYSELMQEVEEAKKAENFDEAKSLLKLLRKKMKPKKPETARLPEPPEDPYIIQQLALVTYKAKHDTPEKEIAALRCRWKSRGSACRANRTPPRDTRPVGSGAQATLGQG